MPRLKWLQRSLSKYEQHYALDIQLAALRRRLYMRAQDIFIVYEILGKNPYILPAMNELSPRCIIDLGAHIGLATLQFKAAFPDAEIHCYEPDPDNFYLLQLNMAGLPGVFLYRAAVGGQRGVATFYVRRRRHAGSSLYSSPKDLDTYEIHVPLKLVDDCLLEAGLPVDIVKFDIEGAEFEAFSNSKLIHTVPLIVGEVKGIPDKVLRFVALFPEHEPTVQWITTGMAYVMLRRRRLKHF